MCTKSQCIWQHKKDKLPNCVENVIILQTEEDENDKFMLFSKSTIIKDMKI